jgi:glycosyltransferase involved in cell wall biosynthesis
MTVRDEAMRISSCLNAVRPWVNEILIADTGSTDGTVKLLEEQYQLRVQHITLLENRCFALADARNVLIEQARNEWVLTLDADETLIMRDPERLHALLTRRNVDGYFGTWLNDYASTTRFEDYKLFLFRRSIRMSGLIHSNATVDLRQKGLTAEWQDCFHVLHESTPEERVAHQPFRRQRLQRAISLQPDWIRYHWFLGYSYSLTGDLAPAKYYLVTALNSNNHLFPVERLNAGVTLAFSYWQQRDQERFREILMRLEAMRLRDENDFEMCVNQATLTWIESACHATRIGADEISPPPQFAC